MLGEALAGIDAALKAGLTPVEIKYGRALGDQ